jgi:hypothetical protein
MLFTLHPNGSITLRFDPIDEGNKKLIAAIYVTSVDGGRIIVEPNDNQGERVIYKVAPGTRFKEDNEP